MLGVNLSITNIPSLFTTVMFGLEGFWEVEAGALPAVRGQEDACDEGSCRQLP